MKVRTRLVLAFGYTLLVVIVALTIPLAINMSARAKTELESQALQSAQTIAAGIGKEGLTPGPALQQQVMDYASQAPVNGRVIAVGPNGRILADSDGAPTGENYATCARPEILAALGTRCTADGTIVASPPTANTIIRHSDTLNAELLLAAAPILDEGGVAGAVRITKNIQEVTQAVRNVRIGIIAIGGVGLLVGMVIAFALADSLARPLTRLADAARRIGDGDLAARAGDIGGAREIEELGASFDEMAGRLERTVHAQREFVANASHQLRTPLTGMKLRLEGAAADAADPEVRRQIDAAEAEVDRLAATVDRMLAMARSVEQGEASLLDLRAVAIEAAERWHGRATDLGTNVRASGTAGGVLADAVDIGQIVDNLIDNALVHGAGPVEIETARRGPMIVLAVRDHGAGISSAERARVTERFYRGTEAEASGSGLGLAIARELAEKWGGSLAAVEAPEGASIELELRCVGDPPSPS